MCTWKKLEVFTSTSAVVTSYSSWSANAARFELCPPISSTEEFGVLFWNSNNVWVCDSVAFLTIPSMCMLGVDLKAWTTNNLNRGVLVHVERRLNELGPQRTSVECSSFKPPYQLDAYVGNLRNIESVSTSTKTAREMEVNSILMIFNHANQSCKHRYIESWGRVSPHTACEVVQSPLNLELHGAVSISNQFNIIWGFQ